jgi:predicted nucleic acid-binding protein
MDASALVKRYSQEQGTDAVLRLLATANRVFTSKIAYVELMMTFRRKQAEGTLSEQQFSDLRRRLEQDRYSWILIEVSDEILEIVKKRVIRHSLRALDAIHLSSALLTKKLVGKKLTFVCSDQKLQEAATAQGLTVHNPAV